ncbi:MAG TPA: PKD domain-containing protein [Methanothrix sp.]|nr:PKD domain-containing protein [Methanothrix sp.]
MKWILAVAICLAIFCSGCVEQKESPSPSGSNAAEKSAEKLTVTITSPKSGDILQGKKDVSFDALVSEGKAPLSYRWSSSIDGELSTSRKFMQNPSRLSKGGHVIILTVIDATGSSAQGSVLIEVM